MAGCAAARVARVPVVWHIRDRIAPTTFRAAAVRARPGRFAGPPVGGRRELAATLDTLPVHGRRVLYNPVVVPDSVEPRPPRQHAASATP